MRPERLRELYEHIEPDLYFYPAIDPAASRAKVNRALHQPDPDSIADEP